MRAYRTAVLELSRVGKQPASLQTPIMPGPICPNCGMDVVVTVVSDTGGSGRELRQFCRECERRRTERERDQLRPMAQGLARLLLYGGFLLALLTATADDLGISGRPGFG
jgi:hypothetical protein